MGVKNTCMGYLAASTLTGSSNDNVFIGNIAGTNINGLSSQNTFIGSQSGRSTLTNISNATALGFQTRCNFTESTVIGVGATATANNQIMLGRTTETVYCPGVPTTGSTTYTSLVLSGGLQLQTTYSTAPTANMLGYRVVTTGSAVVLTSTTISNLVNVSVPVGVWNVSYSVSVTVTSGGNVTAQNIVFSATTASTTALSTICGQSKSHSSDTYATNDVYIVSNSFEYQTTSATNIYLNMVSTFSGGAGLTATGYVSLTRMG